MWRFWSPAYWVIHLQFLTEWPDQSGPTRRIFAAVAVFYATATNPAGITLWASCSWGGSLGPLCVPCSVPVAQIQASRAGFSLIFPKLCLICCSLLGSATPQRTTNRKQPSGYTYTHLFPIYTTHTPEPVWPHLFCLGHRDRSLIFPCLFLRRIAGATLHFHVFEDGHHSFPLGYASCPREASSGKLPFMYPVPGLSRLAICSREGFVMLTPHLCLAARSLNYFLNLYLCCCSIRFPPLKRCIVFGHLGSSFLGRATVRIPATCIFQFLPFGTHIWGHLDLRV